MAVVPIPWPAMDGKSRRGRASAFEDLSHGRKSRGWRGGEASRTKGIGRPAARRDAVRVESSCDEGRHGIADTQSESGSQGGDPDGDLEPRRSEPRAAGVVPRRADRGVFKPGHPHLDSRLAVAGNRNASDGRAGATMALRREIRSASIVDGAASFPVTASLDIGLLVRISTRRRRPDRWGDSSPSARRSLARPQAETNPAGSCPSLTAAFSSSPLIGVARREDEAAFGHFVDLLGHGNGYSARHQSRINSAYEVSGSSAVRRKDRQRSIQIAEIRDLPIEGMEYREAEPSNPSFSGLVWPGTGTGARLK